MSAIPDWLTGPMREEMHRLRRSSKEAPALVTDAYDVFDRADSVVHDDSSDWWCFSEMDRCWLSETGHKALAAIEAEEAASSLTRSPGSAVAPPAGWTTDWPAEKGWWWTWDGEERRPVQVMDMCGSDWCTIFGGTYRWAVPEHILWHPMDQPPAPPEETL